MSGEEEGWMSRCLSLSGKREFRAVWKWICIKKHFEVSVRNGAVFQRLLWIEQDFERVSMWKPNSFFQNRLLWFQNTMTKLSFNQKSPTMLFFNPKRSFHIKKCSKSQIEFSIRVEKFTAFVPFKLLKVYFKKLF